MKNAPQTEPKLDDASFPELMIQELSSEVLDQIGGGLGDPIYQNYTRT
jgi:hypothetical protein